ncbi:MAG TPA: GFA family protein [Burkholderiales bacterium]|nr:GFA family protein [Burkholderiales bacterium]
MSDAPHPRSYSGGCHCRAVRFEVEATQPIDVIDCNCSICAMTGFLHLVVPASRFRLLCGEGMIETYTFGTGVAKHHFCRLCGIKSFYVPRSNPDGFSINVRCLDGYPDLPMTVEPFDGQHWENAGPALRHLSREK